MTVPERILDNMFGVGEDDFGFETIMPPSTTIQDQGWDFCRSVTLS